MAAKIFRINYKSDFILTLNSDAGWMTPFCIKFWTCVPSQAFYAGWDGETYTHCSFDPSEPTKLLVQFDDHHLPIGDLKFQVAYHFTVADFPNDTEDEVINPANITTEIDGETYQVMLDFTGETAPEIQFSLPAYANEAQRIANEEQRIAAEETRIDNEAQRIQNEETRISQEEARVREFATLKRDAQEATTAANDAAALANQKAKLAADKAQLAADKAALAQDAANLANQKAQLAADKAALAQDAANLANQKAQLAADKAALAQDAADLANQKAQLAQQKAEYAQSQGDYAKQQGDYAKEQGDYAKRKGDDAAAQMQQQAQAFSEAQAARQTAYEQSEGTESGSVAGDGSRWGAFKTNEAARDAKVDAKVADITNLQEAVAEGAVYDVSAKNPTAGPNNDGKWGSLSALLSDANLNTLIPSAFRRGGMSIKFVLSSDNKYVQARCMAQNFTTDVTQWQGVDDVPTPRSKNLAESGGVSGQLLNNLLIGNGSTAYSYIYGLIPNTKYCILLEHNDWILDSGSTPATGFAVHSVKNEVGNAIIFVSAQTPAQLSTFYSFTTPNDFDYIRVSGRAANGTKVRFRIMELKHYEEMERIVIADGSIGNTGNAFLVHTEVVKTNGAKYVELFLNRPNLTGYHYKFGVAFTSSLNDIGKVTNYSSWAGGISNSNPTSMYYIFPVPNNAVGVAFTIREESDSDTSIYNTLRKEDFNQYAVNVQLSSKIAEYLDGKLRKDLDDRVGQFESVDYGLVNGSQGNPSNAWVITIKGSTAGNYVIPVTKGHKYKVVVDKPTVDGFNYYYWIYTYNKLNPSNLNIDGVVRDEHNTKKSINEIIDIRDGEVGLTIGLTELKSINSPQQEGECVKLRATDFAEGDIMMFDVTNSFYSDIWNLQEEINEISSEDVVKRNKDKKPFIINACKFGKYSNSFQEFQALICTDMHNDRIANINAIDATNGFETILAYINPGDIVASNYTEETARANFASDFSKLTKSGFIVCGNHDVGNSFYVGYCCNHDEAYNAYIKPMVDNGWLENGEYEAGKPYWYHDDSNKKVRFIGLYEYDDNLDLDETYWKAITYNSSYVDVAVNTQYNVGAKVNAGIYTDYSFECVQAVTTPSSFNDKTTPEKLPSYKVQRGVRVIRQTQAQWFLDTLAGTPASYRVIVIMHNPFSDNARTIEAKFSYPSNVLGSDWSQNSMETDFIRNVLVAFNKGQNYSEKIVMSGNASYLNTLNDGNIDYAFEVSKDFSAINTGVYLLGIIGGHAHRDFIWKDAIEKMYQVAPNCAKVDALNDQGGDVRRTIADGLCHDSLTVVALSSREIALVKIGVNVTERGTYRDFEVIDKTS